MCLCQCLHARVRHRSGTLRVSIAPLSLSQAGEGGGLGINLDRGLALKHTLPASLRSRAVFGCAWDIPVYPSGSRASYNSEFWNIIQRLESPILAIIETIAATSPGTTTCGNRGAGQTSEHFPGSIVAQKVTANPNSQDVCRNSCGKRIVSSLPGRLPGDRSFVGPERSASIFRWARTGSCRRRNSGRFGRWGSCRRRGGRRRRRAPRRHYYVITLRLQPAGNKTCCGARLRRE